MTCKLCGGTKKLPKTGEPCPECTNKVMAMFEDMCLTVPQAYRGLTFTRKNVKDDLGEDYVRFLDAIYKENSKLSLFRRNYFIASPPKHSKTLMCYSAIQQLFHDHVPTYPLFDLNEIRRLILDMEQGNASPYVSEGMDIVPENLYQAPILFAKVPDVLTYGTIDTLLLLLDRRTRRSNTTIFIYNGTWENMLKMDRQNRLRFLDDDGTLGTLSVHSWKSPYEKVHNENENKEDKEVEN